MENLTQSEKAALYYQIIEHCRDWKAIYKIAVGPERYEKLNDSSKNASASKWKQSERIQRAHREIERNLHAAKKEIEDEAVNKYIAGSTEATPGEKTTPFNGEVNFLDPEEFLKHANEQANKIKDDKERRSWLEMIAKLMNYKDKEEEATEIKRYYIMKTCENCEIYAKCKGCNLSTCPNL